MQDMRKQRRESLAQAMVASGALARVEQRVKAKFAVKKVRMKELATALDYEYERRGGKKRPKELQNTQRVFLAQALADTFDYDKDAFAAAGSGSGAGSAAGAGGAKQTSALRVFKTKNPEAGEERTGASVISGAGTDSSSNDSSASADDYDSSGGAASSYSDESSDGSEERLRPAKRTRKPVSTKSLSAWVGRKVVKHFPGHGFFQGRAESVQDTKKHGEVLSVRYKDGDAEDYDAKMMMKGIALYKERKRQHHSRRRSAQLGAAAVVAVEEAQSVCYPHSCR
jgi:hypothetical protein